MECLHISTIHPQWPQKAWYSKGKQWLFNRSFIFHSDHTYFSRKRPHSTKCDITAGFSGSNNWILLIKLVHKRILLKQMQIINLENAILNSKRVVKICYRNSLLVCRVIWKSSCAEFFWAKQASLYWLKDPGNILSVFKSSLFFYNQSSPRVYP